MVQISKMIVKVMMMKRSNVDMEVGTVDESVFPTDEGVKAHYG
jgi:hypothetical protein